MNTFTKSIAMAVMASAVTTVYAQPAEIPGRGPIPFNAIDLDGNGTISAQEFDTVHQQRMSARAAEGRPMRGMANGHSYADFDTDGNGQLTPDELATGQHVQMQKRQAMGMGQGQGQGQGMEEVETCPRLQTLIWMLTATSLKTSSTKPAIYGSVNEPNRVTR